MLQPRPKADAQRAGSTLVHIIEQIVPRPQQETKRPSLDGVSRRAVLALTSAFALGGAMARAQAQPAVQAVIQAHLGDGQRFEPGLVVEIARALAKRPFAPPPSDLPDVFTNLSYEAYIGIKALPGAMLWEGENRGFTAVALHRGFVFSNPVTLFAVEDGVVRRVAYERGSFEFGRLNVPATLGDIGFSGVKLAALSEGGAVDFAILQGATFFRAIARGQNFGVTARALTLRPAEARGEEVPAFRALWLERPSPGSGVMVLHGLLDSESAAGAVRMTFRPGEVTFVDVELTLCPRVALDHVGIAGMNSTYLFAPNDRRNVDDVRPAVHEAEGIEMLNGQGERIWRPLQNPETLQISAFVDRNPRGFGLVQRRRAYDSFQDDEQRFERRPTLWIEPLGEWGEGTVQLIEIPLDTEVNKNILAYWRPKAPLAAGSETAFNYRQHWCWQVPGHPGLAQVAQTRVGRGGNARRRRFLVDFSGETLGAAVPDLRIALTANPGTIHGLKHWAYPDRRTLRVGFDLDPNGEPASEMRLVLESGGKPLSETWLYRWTP